MRRHSADLIVSTEHPYKEVNLGNGYILFTELHPAQSHPHQFSTDQPRTQFSNSFRTTHGYKNLYGFVVIQLTTTTYWTYDYSTVISGYTTAIAEPKMLGWGLKNKSVDGPLRLNYDREWQWTASGVFSYNVAGIEFDTMELITDHKVDYKGSYSYRYRVVD